ncbi:MAG: hypothetical protein AB8B95_03560 [Pseudohongiellaceae bacterium]
MKQLLMQNRLVLVGTVAALGVLATLVVSGRNTAVLTSGAEEGVLAQVETILATSARHVFDEDYWIANMHSIRTSKF